jgi:hypothetical protein
MFDLAASCASSTSRPTRWPRRARRSTRSTSTRCPTATPAPTCSSPSRPVATRCSRVRGDRGRSDGDAALWRSPAALLLGARGNSGVILSQMLGASPRGSPAPAPDERKSVVLAEALRDGGHRGQLRRGRHAGRGHDPQRDAAAAEAAMAVAPDGAPAPTCFTLRPRRPARRWPARPSSSSSSPTPASSTPAAAGSCVILDAAETALTGRRRSTPSRHRRRPTDPVPVPLPTGRPDRGRPGVRGDVPPRRRGRRRPELRARLAGPRRLARRGRRRRPVERPRPRRRRRRRDRGRHRAGRPHRVRVTHFAEQVAEAPREAEPAGRKIVAVTAGPGLAAALRGGRRVVVVGGPGSRPSTGRSSRRSTAAARPRSSSCPTTPTRSRRRDRGPHRRGVRQGQGRGHPDPRRCRGSPRSPCTSRAHLRPGRAGDDRGRPARPPRRGHRRRPPGDHDGRPLRARRRARRHRGRLRDRRPRPPEVADRRARPAARRRRRAGHAGRRRGRAGSPSAARRHRPHTRLSTSWSTTAARSATRSSSRWSEPGMVITLEAPRRGRARRPDEEAQGHRRGPRPRDRRRPAPPLPAPLPRDRQALRPRRAREGQLLTIVGEVGLESEVKTYTDRRTGKPAYRVEVQLRADGRPAEDDLLRQEPAAWPRHFRDGCPGPPRDLPGQGVAPSARVAAHEPADGALRQQGRGPRAAVAGDDAEVLPDLPADQGGRHLGPPACRTSVRWRAASASRRRWSCSSVGGGRGAPSGPGRAPAGRRASSRRDERLPFELTAGQRAVGPPDAPAAAGRGRLRQDRGRAARDARTVDSGGQAALLAPTEVLAQQHHRSITAMLGDLAEGGMLGGAEGGHPGRPAHRLDDEGRSAESDARRDRQRRGRHRHRHPRPARGGRRVRRPRPGRRRRAAPLRRRAARRAARQGRDARRTCSS